MQEVLQRAGTVFGRQMRRAVKRFQQRRGLTADGIAGPATRRALRIGPGAVLKRRRPASSPRGSGRRSTTGRSRGRAVRGGGVRALQRRLGLSADGVFGPQTQRAVKRFQRRRLSIYANSGHMYMTIDGRRFDTSARSSTGTRWSSEPRSSSGFVVRHPPGL